MTDRTNHRLEAEGLLDYAYEATDQAGELPALVYAAVHALLAIHDTLTAADRYAANEAKQREAAEPDPLDEDDHRDRLDRDGMRLTRVGPHHWHPSSGARCGLGCNGLSLANWNSSYGPLAFAPEPPPDGARDDLTASEGESGSVEGDGSHDASKALLCPECGHDIEDHWEYCCGCTRSPAVVVYALIEQAVNAKRTRMTAQLRQVISSVQDSGDLAEFDALADAWEADTDG